MDITLTIFIVHKKQRKRINYITPGMTPITQGTFCKELSSEISILNKDYILLSL